MLDSAYVGQEEWLGKIGADKKQLFISVDEALEINRKLGLKAFHGGYKVLILWLPETMRVDTANKLLKLIEEPTEKTVMLFVSQIQTGFLQQFYLDFKELRFQDFLMRTPLKVSRK